MIETYSEDFAFGYDGCAWNDKCGYAVTLNIGTNNDVAGEDGAIGAAWGSLERYVASQIYGDGIFDVTVQAAIDAEPGFATFLATQNWEWGDSTGVGFLGRSGDMIVNYGSADGCPQYFTSSDVVCSGDWTTSRIYYLSWGWPVNLAQPEIYYDSCYGFANQPIQWTDISASGGGISFTATLSQNYCLSATTSYNDLVWYAALYGSPHSIPYLTRILTD